MDLNVIPGSKILVQIETDRLGLAPTLCLVPVLCLRGLQGLTGLQMGKPTEPLR